MGNKGRNSESHLVTLGITKLNGVDNQGFSHDTNIATTKQNGHSHNVPTQTNKNGSISIIAGPTTSDNNNSTTPFTTPVDTTVFPGSSRLSNGDANGTSKPHSKPEDSTPPKKDDVQLKRSLNIWYCSAIMVAVTGHSSIFISPSQIIATSGSLGSALVIWLVGGLINLGTALCFAELGTMYPKAGGPYNMAMKSFGPMVGFLLLWGYAILIAGPFWAFLAYTAALYIVRPLYPDCLPDDIIIAIRLLAGWIIVSSVVINCVYMKYVTRFQTLLSSCKVIALLILIGIGIYNIVNGETENFEDMFEGTTQEPGKIALAFFYSIFSYGGWQVMTTMLEEMKNPARDAPVSIYISFAVVISKYIMTNVAYATLMSRQDIIDSPAVALDFTDRMYSPLVAVISVLVALTSIGALNASIMGHSRLLFGGAREGQLPQILGMVHVKYLTPWPSIFVYTVLSLIMLFSGGVTDMMEFISLFATIMNLVVILSLLHHRYTKPLQPRPYKPWLWIPILMVAINLAVLVLGIYQKPTKLGIALAILFSGVPVYLFGWFWRKSNDPEIKGIMDNFTARVQKLLMVTKTKQS